MAEETWLDKVSKHGMLSAEERASGREAREKGSLGGLWNGMLGEKMNGYVPWVLIKKEKKTKHQRLGALNNTKNKKQIWKIYTIQLLDFNTKAQ